MMNPTFLIRFTHWICLGLICLLGIHSGFSQTPHTVAREWNEMLLTAIRQDLARPTVHARNLFHCSIAMYDSWAVYDPTASTFFLGNGMGNFTNTFLGVPTPNDKQAAQEEAMSYAMYRLLKHRFARSPGRQVSLPIVDSLMQALGYDAEYTETNYRNGRPAALGNYIAEQLIAFGFQDGSNEQSLYENLYYYPRNASLLPTDPGNDRIFLPNRWQPLTLSTFIGQSGFPSPGRGLAFLSPEWGQVVPFALDTNAPIRYERDDFEYWVYHDPGAPPYIQEDGGGTSSEYQWGFSLVSIWGAHLDPRDSVMWDISPASLGNISSFPDNWAAYRDFYNQLEGGDPSQGHAVNPYTGQPYEPQWVPRGDYTRVLAEFWADGPDSETPPGHWFTILNYVSDHPLLEKRFKGEGPILEDLEWEVKSYLILSGAVHDAAIAAWGIKGWYDYVRPISAIRYMARMGQSTDQSLPNYDPQGIPLLEGYIEMVEEGDSLAGDNNEHVGKIKLYTWRGPDYIEEPETDMAGVGWILADNWWPYQRPTFVTPPFAGYVSGHSTFSRAAAEVLTLLTGDPFFPGGMGEFKVKKNEFLVFEEGPSVDFTLQWATYRDASDQTSLSRIWGGIHPPADDIPGRIIGEQVGINAFNYALPYFNIENANVLPTEQGVFLAGNPLVSGQDLGLVVNTEPGEMLCEGFDLQGRRVFSQQIEIEENKRRYQLPLPRNLENGIYLIHTTIGGQETVLKLQLMD